MSANFTPSQQAIKNMMPFRFWCQKVLPTVYDDSLSYYELLTKVVNYLNDAVDNIDTLNNNVQNIYSAYILLQNYVNDYFDQEFPQLVSDKLDEMAEDGTLTALIKAYIDPYFDEKSAEIEEAFDAQDERITNEFNTQNSIIAGHGTTIAELNAQMVNFVADHAGLSNETTLWTGTANYVGATMELSESIDSYKYIDVEFQDSANSWIQRFRKDVVVLANAAGVCLPSQPTSNVGVLPINISYIRFGVPNNNTDHDVLSIVKCTKWSWDTTNSPTVADASEGSTLGVAIRRVIGVKDVQNDTEVIDIRVGYNGKIYQTAGDAVREQVTDLNNFLSPYYTKKELLVASHLASNNNTALVNNNNGSYTVGTTDLGNSTFGYQMTVEPGEYYLFGVPNGIAFLSTTGTPSTSYTNRFFENTSNAPKKYTATETIQLWVCFRSPSRPSESYTIYPSFYQLNPKIDRVALMENTLADGTDLNNIRNIGVYLLNSEYTYSHAPEIPNGGLLYVHSVGNVLLQMAIRYGTSVRTFTPTICFRWGSPSSITSDWKYMGRQHGLRTAFIGDSVIWGRNGNGQATDRTPYIITNAIEHNLGIACENMGVSGMGWIKNGDGGVKAYDVVSSLTLSNYDALIFSLGVNDGYSPLGTWNSTDETTIMGQFNKCIQYIMTNRPQMRVVVIAPINGKNVGTFPDYWYGPRENPDGYVSRRVLSDTLKTACAYYWIPYIEQYDGPINPYSIQTLIGSDGVHPSNAGYIELGRWMSEKLGAVL